MSPKPPASASPQNGTATREDRRQPWEIRPDFRPRNYWGTIPKGLTAEALGACLGHGRGDSKGQQRYRAVSHDLASTSANAQEQQHPPGRAVYGMQGVRGSNPLSSTLHQRKSARAVPTYQGSGVLS
jgi:hypothetical protein